MACPPNAPDANDVRVSTKALFRIRDPSVLRSPVPRLPIASNANRASSQAISRTSAVMLSQSVTPNATALTPLTNNSWLSGHSARPSAFATPSTVLQAPTTGFGQPTSRLLTPQNGQTPVDHIVTWSTLSKAQDNPPFTRGQPSAAPLIRPTAHTPCLGQVLEPLPISAHTVSTKPRSRTPVAPLSASTHLAHESSKQRSVIRSYPTPQSEKSALAPCRPLTSLLTQSVQPKASRPLLDCRRSVDPLLWSSQPTAAQNASARLADIAETYGHFDVCLAKWWIRVDTANGAVGVVVEGERMLPNGPFCTWKSSFVADRLAANKVRTINGKVYLLDGECNIARMQTFGYSARKIKLFLNGFPTNWQDILPPDAGKDQLALAPVHLPVTRSQTPQASPVVHAQAKRSELVPRADDLTLSAMAFAETTASKFALPSEPRGRSVLSETSSLVQSGGSPGDSCTHTPVPNDYSPPADLPSQSTALPKALKPPPKSAPAPRRSRRISQRTRRSLATSPLLPAKPRSERSTHSSLPANATPSPAPVLKFVWGQSEPVIQVAGRYVPFSCYAAQDKSPSMVTRGKRKRQVLLSESGCVDEQLVSPTGTKAECRRTTRSLLAQQLTTVRSLRAKKVDINPGNPPLSSRPTPLEIRQLTANCRQDLLFALDSAEAPTAPVESTISSDEDGDIRLTPLPRFHNQPSVACSPNTKRINAQVLYQRVTPGTGVGRWHNPHIAAKHAAEPSWATNTTYDLSD